MAPFPGKSVLNEKEFPSRAYGLALIKPYVEKNAHIYEAIPN